MGFRRAAFYLSNSGRPPGSLRHSGKTRRQVYVNCCEREKIIDFYHPSCLIRINQVDQFCIIEVDQFWVIVSRCSKLEEFVNHFFCHGIFFATSTRNLKTYESHAQ